MRNEEVRRAQEEYDRYIQENLKKAAMKRLSDEEREAILQVSPPSTPTPQGDSELEGSRRPPGAGCCSQHSGSGRNSALGLTVVADHTQQN